METIYVEGEIWKEGDVYSGNFYTTDVLGRVILSIGESPPRYITTGKFSIEMSFIFLSVYTCITTTGKFSIKMSFIFLSVFYQRLHVPSYMYM